MSSAYHPQTDGDVEWDQKQAKIHLYMHISAYI